MTSAVLIENIRPGMKSSEVYEMAVKKTEVLEVLKVEDAFLNFGDGRRSKMIGHGVSLELNEPPILLSYDLSEIPENCVLALDMHMMDETFGVVKLGDRILIGE